MLRIRKVWRVPRSQKRKSPRLLRGQTDAGGRLQNVPNAAAETWFEQKNLEGVASNTT